MADRQNSETKQQKVTFALERVESLATIERNEVEGLAAGVTEGLIIKEYKSGSFVGVRKFLPHNNLFTSQLRKELTQKERSFISQNLKPKLGV